MVDVKRAILAIVAAAVAMTLLAVAPELFFLAVMVGCVSVLLYILFGGLG